MHGVPVCTISNGCADPHSQLLKAMHVIRATEHLIDASPLPTGQQMRGNEFVHGGERRRAK